MTKRVRATDRPRTGPTGRSGVRVAMQLVLPALLIVTAAAAAGQPALPQKGRPKGPAPPANPAPTSTKQTLLRGLDLGNSKIAYPGRTPDQAWDVVGERAIFHSAKPLAEATCKTAAASPIRLWIPVGRPGALGARTTRVTVVWSVLKFGWAESAIEVRGHEMRARADHRPTQPPAAGRRLSLDLPAARVLGAPNLAVEVRIAVKCRGGAKAVVRVDALELEVLG